METHVPIKITAHEQLCIERVPHRPCGFVIFGASGDLTKRKLIPALFNLYREKLLPKKFFVLGTGRTTWDDAKFRGAAIQILKEDPRRDMEMIRQFSEQLYYAPCDYTKREAFGGLKSAMGELDGKHTTGGNTIFYLSIPPTVYETTIRNLIESGMLKPDTAEMPQTQIVVEKPFGTDLESARTLAAQTMKGLSEKQVYRIDHYLGKETVQNILMFRFANSIFEPVWNSKFIDHVQITAAETIGVEHRAGYYESSGVLRDMFQNHMLELLSLVAMEPPSSFDPLHYREEKSKVLKSIQPIPQNKINEYFVRGQYTAGLIGSSKAVSYREEQDVNPNSETETYAALKLFIDTPRWQGVPFYLRSGKRMAEHSTDIIIQFKHIPHSIFSRVPPDQIPANQLHIRIQPNEGIQLCFNAKHPGPKMCMATLGLEFNYNTVFDEKDLSAYERLILDCMHADPTLFVSQNMVEVAWALIEDILKTIKTPGGPALHFYEAGSWGPVEADKLIGRDGHFWAQ